MPTCGCYCCMSEAAGAQIFVLCSELTGGMDHGRWCDRGCRRVGGYIMTLPDGATAVCLKLHALRSLSFTVIGWGRLEEDREWQGVC